MRTKPDFYRTAYPLMEYYVFFLVNLTDFEVYCSVWAPLEKNMIMPGKRRFYSGAKYTIIDAQIIRIHSYAVNRNCAISITPTLEVNRCRRMRRHAAYIHLDQLRMTAHARHSAQSSIAWERSQPGKVPAFQAKE